MHFHQAICLHSARHAFCTALVAGVLAITSAPGMAEELGTWEPPIAFDIVPIHLVHLPTGKILVFDEPEGSAGIANVRIYDPVTGALTVSTPPTSLFCAGHAGLGDGRILVSGGRSLFDTDSSIFDPFAETWSLVASMHAGRYYPTLTTLADGRVLAVAGTGSGAADPGIPEIYDPQTDSWTKLSSTARKKFGTYPRNFLAPGGEVVAVGGKSAQPFILDLDTQIWTALPIDQAPARGAAVMYEPGKVMKAGADYPGTLARASNRTAVADFNDVSPMFRTAAPMAFARTFNQLTLLADGTVLSTGGVDQDANAVFAAEVWDPETETWTTLSAMDVVREHHSTALLLQSGQVMVAGGETSATGTAEKSAQLFNPPYLFRGPRPSITSVPATVEYGAVFEVTTPDAASVAKVSLVRPGAVTHSFDQNQRFMWLDFTPGTEGLTVQAPADPNLAPPGYYMLFLISDMGAPSVVASYIRVGS